MIGARKKPILRTKNVVFTASCLGLLLCSVGVQAAALEAVTTSQELETGSDIASGLGEVVLDRPATDVAPVVLDYAHYVDFMPNFTKSRVLAERGSRAMVYIEVSLAGGALTLWGQLDLSERSAEGDTRVIEAQLVQGNIKTFEAEWTLEPIEDGARTLLSFRIHVDPDLPLPASVISRENERAARRSIEALRNHLEGKLP